MATPPTTHLLTTPKPVVTRYNRLVLYAAFVASGTWGLFKHFSTLVRYSSQAATPVSAAADGADDFVAAGAAGVAVETALLLLFALVGSVLLQPISAVAASKDTTVKIKLRRFIADFSSWFPLGMIWVRACGPIEPRACVYRQLAQ